tara:strand:+ start:181 stop:792 length:612 start_codon:yes stop_codon:yes gene_type:complete
MKKILLLSALAIFLNSCSDIETPGCIDPAAYNYESFADYDDGSCLYILGCTDPEADNYNPDAGLEPLNGCDYSCEVVWYLTQSTAVFMINEGIDYYHFFLKDSDNSFGSIGNQWAWDFAPDCTPQLDFSTLVIIYEWEGNYDSNASILQWEAWADDGSIILILDYEGDEIVYPNECISIGLTSQQLKTYKEEHKEKKRREKIK